MKRYPVLAGALGLLLSFVPVQAQEEESHDLVIREIESDDGEEYEYQEETDSLKTVIVVLRDPSLLAAGLDPESTEGREYAAQLNDAQQGLLADTARVSPKSVIEVRHTYTSLLNGFSLTADDELIAILSENDAVDHVSVSKEYALPETTDEDAHVMGSLIRPVDGENGEGMVIGIIDSGLDTDHSAFSVDPPSPAITEPVSIEDMHAEGRTFKSLKVPFAYDYAGNFGIYSRADDDVRGGSDHGTHVSGIAAGNDEEIKGVARDAQIAFFKVFPNDGETAQEADIIAALEDAVLLHPSVVNMSLGEPCGFTTGINGAYDELMTAVDLTAQQGITMAVSCGNESYVGYQGINGSLPSTANPSYGTVSSPAVYPSSLAVAAVDSEQTVSDCFTVGERTISFVDPARREETRFIHLHTPVRYVAVPGTGSESDYEGLDVQGKVVLVSRENNQFIKKQQTAAAMGAAGIIIYNHLDGLITIEIDDASIPCIVVTREEGEYLLAAKDKRITAIEEKSVFVNETAGMISWFSSRGPSEDLCLKPEITAPGGHIYSALNSGMYGDMSGTSMAAPHASAALAIVESHLEKTYGRQDAAEKVLMGSAVPIRQDNGYVSVRAQGAGLISLQNAFASDVFADVNGGRPKFELGDISNGRYVFDFALNAMAEPTDMTVEIYIAAEEAENGRFTMTPHVLSGTLSGDTSVRVEGRTAVHTVFALDQESLAYLDGFEDGNYVEGYVFCKALDFTLSIPFLSFYGDWEKAEALDRTVVDADEAVIGVTGIVSALSMQDAEKESFHGVRPIVGQNPYDPEYSLTTPAAEKAVCIASNSSVTNTSRNSGIYYLNLPFVRNVERYEIDIRNEEGVSIYNRVFEGQKRKFYAPTSRFLQEVRWRPMDHDGRVVPEGSRLEVIITASLDAAHPEKSTSTSFGVYIDNTPPSLSDARLVVLSDGRRQLRFTAADNMCLAHAGLLDASGNELQSVYFYDEEHGTSHAVVFDVTDVPGNSFTVVLHDTTRFEKKFGLSLTEELPSLRLAPEEVQADAGTLVTFTAFNEADETVDASAISWSAVGNTSAATTIRKGVLTVGRDEKAARLTVTAKYHSLTAQAEVSVRPYCAVTVSSVEGGRVSVDRSEVLAGESVHVSVQTDPGYELLALTANGQPIVNNTVEVSEDTLIEAVFVRIVYTVRVYTQGQGSASFAVESAYYGEEKTVVFTPAEGWQLSSLAVNGKAETPKLSYTFKVRQDTEIQAVFTRKQYAVDVETSAGGKAEPDHLTVSHGDSASIRFLPETGYELESLTVNGKKTAPANPLILKVTQETKVSAVFARIRCAVAVSTSGKGSYTLSSSSVLYGDSVRISLTPAEGYELAAVTINGRSTAAVSPLVLTVTEDTEVAVSFTPRKYMITVTAGSGGRISTAGGTYAYDSTLKVTASPDKGYRLASWRINGRDSGSANPLVYTVKGEAAIEAVFEKDTALVEVSVEGKGIVTPSGPKEVPVGSSFSVAVKETEGHVFESMSVDGASVPLKNGKYDFTVEKDTQVRVRFRMLHIEFYKGFWYENGVRQGTYDDQYGVRDTQYGGFIRGREIYDPATDAWYWLDAVYDGAVAKNKEVWMPYVFQGDNDPEGKWVRYDGEGHMIKGWYFNENGAYYYDLITGAMFKGEHYIEGVRYEFDPVTGICR